MKISNSNGPCVRSIILVLSLAVSIASSLSAQTPAGDGEQAIGPPFQKPPAYNNLGAQPTGMLRLTLTVVNAAGMPVKGMVDVKINLWPPPKTANPTMGNACVGATAAIASLAAMQRAKAKAIADALNAQANIKAAYATFNPAKMITLVDFMNPVDPVVIGLFKGVGIANIYDTCMGRGTPLPAGNWQNLAIPNVPANIRPPAKVLMVDGVPDPTNPGKFLPGTNEIGDGWRILLRGTMGALGVDPDGAVTVASGPDDLGIPSMVQFGIKDGFIASDTTTAGESELNILLSLARSLADRRIPVSFDWQQDAALLNAPAGKTLDWGYNDPGLTFLASTAPVAFPECPPVGAVDGCQYRITLESDCKTTTIDEDRDHPDHDSWWYDSGHIVLVGVVNKCDSPLHELDLTGHDIFDLSRSAGLCGGETNPQPIGCPFGPTLFEGPATGFNIRDHSNGLVHFLDGGLRSGESAYFALGHPPEKAYLSSWSFEHRDWNW